MRQRGLVRPGPEQDPGNLQYHQVRELFCDQARRPAVCSRARAPATGPDCSTDEGCSYQAGLPEPTSRASGQILPKVPKVGPCEKDEAGADEAGAAGRGVFVPKSLQSTSRCPVSAHRGQTAKSSCANLLVETRSQGTAPHS